MEIKRFLRRRTSIVQIFIISNFLFWGVILQAQITHNYPRICTANFGGGVAQWYARHDMVVSSNTSVDFAQEIKNINPNTYVLSSSDWNAGLEDRSPGYIKDPFPEEWFIVESTGEKSDIYGGNFFLVDMTNLCQVVDGKRFNEYLPEFLVNDVDLSVFDGIVSQGLWERPLSSRNDIDLNRDQINDYTQFGKTWVDSVWLAGVETLIANFKINMPTDKLLLINTGGFSSWGWEDINGFWIENSWSIGGSWLYFKNKYANWTDQAREPHVMLINGTAKYDAIHRPEISKNYFMMMSILVYFY